jgi:hypothetical protein
MSSSYRLDEAELIGAIGETALYGALPFASSHAPRGVKLTALKAYTCSSRSLQRSMFFTRVANQRAVRW